jgi:carotenoid cleavage dioxygenase
VAVHDARFAINSGVFTGGVILCPVVFSIEDLQRRGSMFTWEPDRGTRIGVMPRDGGNADVRWYDTDPCYVFHPLNAYEEDGTLVLDVARYPRLDFMSPRAARDPGYDGDTAAKLHRWRIDLCAGGGVRSEPLDDVAAEFPRADERLLGRKHRWGYLAAAGGDGTTRMPTFSAIRRYDLERGTVGRVTSTRQRVASHCSFRADPMRPRTTATCALAYDHTRDAATSSSMRATSLAAHRARFLHRVLVRLHGLGAA